MLQDLKNGKPAMWIPSTALCASGATGVAFLPPVNDKIVQVIKQIQNGTLTASEENLKLFTGLL